MISEHIQKIHAQKKREIRIRKSIARSGRPRLSVFRSLKHVYAQIIDDTTGMTVVGCGSYSKELKDETNRKEVAKKVGLKLAELAKEKNIKEVVFDRGSFKFHGRIGALAEGAREGGLSF